MVNVIAARFHIIKFILIDMKYYMQKSPWFYIQKPNPTAKIRLFCFPYAGGGASIFRDWHQFLPSEFEVVAVCPPGRENRFNEELISSMPVLVNTLHKNILPLLDKPFIFFGHSNGALICFELSRSLRHEKIYVPERIILSAKCPPHIPSGKERISQLPDTEFLAELEDMSGTPKDILQNKELMALLMPMLRADFALSENVVYEEDILLKCPATLFYGLQDKITLDQIMAWQDLFLEPVQTVMFSGGHFFIEDQRDQILFELNRILIEQLNLQNTEKFCIAN